MEKQTDWYPALPADGDIEFPTMGKTRFAIRVRHDGNYEMVMWEEGETTGHGYHLSPDTDIAICIRKTPEQAAQDEAAFRERFNAIMGAEVL